MVATLQPGRLSDTQGYNSLNFREAFQAILTSLRLEGDGLWPLFTTANFPITIGLPL